ncbi:MAG: NUDIX hydrolase [Oscillospiraceae bacterium]
MDYRDAVENFKPLCPQEEADRAFFLDFMEKNADCLSRDNDLAHFTASAWVVNKARDKVLMVYHNIYKSWSWTGGHADGEADLAAVALREVREETGLADLTLLCPSPLSLEALTVDGHVKRGRYVHAHLHLNLTYLIEADENAALSAKPDENSGVRWLSREDAVRLPTETWMVENIYKKLLARV